MKTLTTAIALVLGLAFAATAQVSYNVTTFPGSVKAMKNLIAQDTLKGRVVKAKVGTDTVAAGKLLTSPRAAVDTLNGFVITSHAVIDSAKTGYATIPVDTLRLSCGLQVCGTFVAGFSANGSGTAMTVGTLPAACRPLRATRVPILFQDNDTLRTGSISWASTGIGTLSRANATGSITATLVAAGVRAIPAGAGFCFTRY